ncbi:hypothetical protein ACHAQA_004380 [Verticillium albo-atrum]
MGSISTGDDYVLGRGIRESIRLDAQHLLWKLYLGYTLHPKVGRSESLKIAEIGTGTAWVGKLPKSLEQGSFLTRDQKIQTFPPSLTQLCTNTYLMALTEIFGGIKKSDNGDLAPHIASCENTLAQLMGESNQGLVYNWGPTSVLAQKPSQ